MSRAFRQLLLGVDAMEWSLVKRWAGEGKLPAFRRLMDEGLQATLASPAAYLPDTAWTALSCGVNPGKLGKYFYVQYDARTARLRYAPDSEVCASPFWRYLADAGVKAGIVDVPHMPFEDLPHGFRLAQWGAHDTVQQPVASPPSLLDEVNARIGLHPVGDCERYDAKTRSSRLRHDILEGVAMHGRLFRWLMAEREWDVYFGAFSAPHCVGHHFWGHATEPDKFVLEVYQAVDREIGLIADAVPENTRMMVMAAHGMRGLHHASWNLNEILDLLGFGKPGASRRTSESTRRAGINPWRILKMTAPASLQYRIKEALPRAWQDWLLYLWYSGGRSCRGRRAFCVPNNDAVGAIRLSVRGRDRDGLVEPGDEYRRLCQEIIEALGELTDPASGRPVVSRMTKLAETCHGPSVDILPDIGVLWDQTFQWNAVQSPRFGTLELRRQDARTGAHSHYGFLLATGPGIPRSLELEGVTTYDIAPTVLAAAGVTPPQHFDGRPIPALMAADTERSLAVHDPAR